ncbi:hypothetical protein BDY21DRAFT_171197 [Lineolata rhizophorae]|uniref:Uncharacterized protein n=1 Tax=Lineolata rhizophorae TaxID=578093 RepID=A0A6A6PA69_9PEZI|nr:hypothetical protein BDY21DRAFT_171197 [Lineolata rhizophorae]
MERSRLGKVRLYEVLADGCLRFRGFRPKIRRRPGSAQRTWGLVKPTVAQRCITQVPFCSRCLVMHEVYSSHWLPDNRISTSLSAVLLHASANLGQALAVKIARRMLKILYPTRISRTLPCPGPFPISTPNRPTGKNNRDFAWRSLSGGS